MRVRNTLTGVEGYTRVFNWWQGGEIVVFVADELQFWKPEHVEIIHDRPIVRTVRIQKRREYRDPFEGYTENEIEAMLEKMSGFQLMKDLLQIERLHRLLRSVLSKLMKTDLRVRTE